MTRENKPAAQSAARRAASLLTGALLLAGLAGCSSDLFQLSDNANPSLTQKAKPAVALSPVQGVPQKYAAQANDQLAASIKASGVALVDAKDAVYVIKPSYAALPDHKKGTKLAYTIDVTDKAGNKIRTITGEELVSPKHGGDSWAHVTGENVQKLAVKSAGDVNAFIDNPSAPVAPAAVASATPAPAAQVAAKPAAAPVKTAAKAPPKAPAASAPAESPSLASAVETPPARSSQASAAQAELVALVPTVGGAPGDGKTSLSEAMKRALGRQGIKVASASAPGLYQDPGQCRVGRRGKRPAADHH